MKSAAQYGSLQSEKSGQEVAEFKTVVRLGKSDTRYWQGRIFRPTYRAGGETRRVEDWAARIQHLGRREVFNLGTANRAAAAAKAREIYAMLQGAGWQAALVKYKPDMQRKAVGTVGELIEDLRGHWAGQPATFEDYCQKFRLIVAQVFGIESEKGRGWRAKRLARIDRIKLADVTPDKVNKWRIGFVKRAGENPVDQRRARISCNSILRMAKSLFAKDLLRHVTMERTGKLPFDGVPFYPRESMRYHGTVDIEAIIAEAIKELEQEPLKIFLLATMAGLRRNEIDKIEWDAFRWDEKVIRIQATQYFTPKTADSAGDVSVDPELLAAFRGWRARASGSFVVEGGTPLAGRRYATYRAQEHFESLTAWLRKKGVAAPKPLHELRKEFGSQICAKAGIYAASRMLRHTDIALTAQHYLDAKERVTVGLGRLLSEVPNVAAMQGEHEERAKVV